MRVANWIFAEEFAQRDGFVEEATTTDDDEDDASETASEEDEAPTSCFGCFARSKSRVAVRSGSTSQKNNAREDEFEEEARESSPLERARENARRLRGRVGARGTKLQTNASRPETTGPLVGR